MCGGETSVYELQHQDVKTQYGGARFPAAPRRLGRQVLASTITQLAGKVLDTKGYIMSFLTFIDPSADQSPGQSSRLRCISV